MPRTSLILAAIACATACLAEPAKSPYTGGNRLAYLDEINPYYPHRDFARLITPQWVGEEGVEAVVILSIDDMRDPVRYEAFLRPILDRLKKVENSDGLSRMSIFTNSVDPKHEQLQTWLKEGLSFEVHTITHPCPCLGSGGPIVGAKPGSIEAAKQTYDGCVDLLHQIPNYKGPVAFRMPCCDSMNSVSPRFFAEVMNKTTSKGHFLSIDSSVFNVFTSDDPALPRELVQEKDGSERFAKYAKFPGFVNTIENYPYPYVIGNMIWQFPCVVPSDWEAQHLHKPNNPKTVEDLKANLDCTVIKRGVFTLVFHPHGWIKAEQIVELIDHAEKKHGKKVKFLNFADALERINKNMLAGTPIRDEKGNNPSVRVLDLDDNRFVDAVIEDAKQKLTNVWNESKTSWHILRQDLPILSHQEDEGGRRFAIWGTELGRNAAGPFPAGAMPQEGPKWPHQVFNIEKLRWDNSFFGTFADAVVLRRAIDGSVCEEIIEYWDGRSEVRDGVHRRRFFPFKLPSNVRLARDRNGADAGLRLIDLDGDRDLDIVFSNSDRFDVYLFVPPKEGRGGGWETRIVATKRGVFPAEQAIPPIIRADGTNNGFFVKGDALYWQNEDTGGKEPGHVKKVTFAELLALREPGRAAPESAPNVDEKPGAARPGSQHGFTTAHATPPPPRTPEASRDSIKVREGFRVELVAAEPLVLDPIAFDWGPDGRLWVVEMGDYPSGIDTPEGKAKPGGRIVYLEDTDNDGKYDKRTLFLDGLNMPTGIMVWKKGVLVTAAPDLFYAEDTTPDNDDRKADKREVLFTGFSEGNPQHRVNGLRWGLDGWIYIANGDSGGNVKAVGTGETVNISGRDLRIRPQRPGSLAADDHEVEQTQGRSTRRVKLGLKGDPSVEKWDIDPQSGQSQYGRDRDDFGNWFANNNPNPGWHYALEDHYLRRNPHVAAPNPRVDLTGDRTIYPISIVHSPSIENHRITPGQPAQHSSANSLTIYRDDLYGEHFAMNAFVSEPVHNLVRRLVLKPNGVTFSASRAAGEERSEFLASSDPWFRPTMLRTGPDGCLWIADMYRQTIEHPQWIPPAWQKVIHLREGDDKGRIYRVVPVHAKPRAMPRLDKLEPKELAAAMDSPNGWQRDMVQMMLLWRKDAALGTSDMAKKLQDWRIDLLILENHPPALKSKKLRQIEDALGQPEATAPLTELARSATRPAVRVQALCTLDQIGLLNRDILFTAIADVDAGVRKQAVRIGWNYRRESPVTHWASKDENKLAAALLKLTDDPHPQVRQQLAYSLVTWGNFDTLEMGAAQGAAGEALARLLIKDEKDAYIIAACMSSIIPHLDIVLRQVINAGNEAAPKTSLLQDLIATAVAADKLAYIRDPLDRMTSAVSNRYQIWQFDAMSRLFDALGKRGVTLADLREKHRSLVRDIDQVAEMAAVAQSIATEHGKEDTLRIAAMEFFGRTGIDPVARRRPDQRLSTFSTVLTDVRSSPDLRRAAAQVIARVGGDRAFATLLSEWKSHTPSLRVTILDALLPRDEGVNALLNAMEQNIVTRHDIDPARRVPLLTHKVPAVRERATKLLGGPVNADRQQVIDRYWTAMQKAPVAAGADAAAKGRLVFEKNCAVCHKLTRAGGDLGKGIGPDLAKIIDGSPSAMLTAILDPNRAVESKYINYLAEKKDGERITGIITTETGTSITMVGVDGKEQVILRSDIESLRSTSLSLMPEGMEQAISAFDMADLLAFISKNEPPAKTFENNTPVKIEADGKGVLTLPASAAEVRGPTVVFEQQYRNLGYWSSEGDHATWTVNVPKDGTYEVTIDYALVNTVKGNAYLLTLGEGRLTGPVPGTGSWDTYKTLKLGTIEMKAGTQRVVFRSAGPVSGALIDLRTVVLSPK